MKTRQSCGEGNWQLFGICIRSSARLFPTKIQTLKSSTRICGIWPPNCLAGRSGPQYSFDDDVRLEYYRLQKISEGSINLSAGMADSLDGPREVGSGVVREQPVPLSRLIDVVNERFGTDFTDADQLFFDQIVEAALLDDGLRQAANANPEDKFALVFDRVLESLFVERMDHNEDIFARFMSDKGFQKLVGGWLVSEVYKKLQNTE